MKIGELSRITGVNIPTIRYYIDLGLLVPEQAGKQFLFNEKDLKSLELINKYKAFTTPRRLPTCFIVAPE